MSDEAARDETIWRRAEDADLDAVVALQERIHRLGHESRAVFASKLHACPRGFLVLARAGRTIGYGVFHPWRLDDVPALHALPFSAPDPPDCLFVHDVALLPEARGSGAAGALVAVARAEARRLGLRWLALVSVYGTVPVWTRHGFAVRAPSAGAAQALAGYGETARYMAAEMNS